MTNAGFHTLSPAQMPCSDDRTRSSFWTVTLKGRESHIVRNLSVGKSCLCVVRPNQNAPKLFLVKPEAKYREEQGAEQRIVFLIERTVDEYTLLEPGTNSTRHDFLDKGLVLVFLSAG